MESLEGIETLGREVRECEAGLIRPERGHAALRARIVAAASAARTRRRSRRFAAFSIFTVVLAAACGILVVRQYRIASSLGFECGGAPGKVGAFLAATPSEPLALRFDEGTTVTLAPNTKGRVAGVSRFGADLVIESGQAALSVVPREGNRWLVHTGPFLVKVTGTRFNVSWDGAKDAFILDLLEGKVVLSGCVFGDGLFVVAGEHVEAACGRGEYRVSRPLRKGDRTEDEVRGSTSTTPQPLAGAAHVGPEPAASSAPESEWRFLAKAGRFSEAYAAAVAEGFDAACAKCDAQELLLLGDTARLSAHDASARAAYRATRERFPRSSAAAAAAFYLGRMVLDEGTDPSSAERWLDAYLDERPQGALAAAALGRLLEMSYARNKDGNDVRALATEYLRRFPSGAHAATAQRILSSELTFSGEPGAAIDRSIRAKGVDRVANPHDVR